MKITNVEAFPIEFPLDAPAQDATDTLATRLIQMRGQVDELQSELNLKREEHKNRMSYLTAQLADGRTLTSTMKLASSSHHSVTERRGKTPSSRGEFFWRRTVTVVSGWLRLLRTMRSTFWGSRWSERSTRSISAKASKRGWRS